MHMLATKHLQALAMERWQRDHRQIGVRKGKMKSIRKYQMEVIHMDPDKLRQLRVTNRITLELVCAKCAKDGGNIDMNRLCQLERGRKKPREGELEMIAAALESLANTRKLMERVAVEGGWPGAI